MAQHQTVDLVDDLDGSTAERTIAFAVDGQQYEIDLSSQNIQRLHKLLAPFMTQARKARPAPGAHRRPRRSRTPAPATAPAATSTPPATTGNRTDHTPAPRPPVPVAVFSNPDQHRPSHTTTTAKPHTAGLFSTAS